MRLHVLKTHSVESGTKSHHWKRFSCRPLGSLAEPIHWRAIMSILNAHSLKVARSFIRIYQLWNQFYFSCFPAQYDLDSFKRLVKFWSPSSLVSLSCRSLLISLKAKVTSCDLNGASVLGWTFCKKKIQSAKWRKIIHKKILGKIVL